MRYTICDKCGRPTSGVSDSGCVFVPVTTMWPANIPYEEPSFPWQELWKLRSEAIGLKAKNKIMLDVLKETCRLCRQPELSSEECYDCRIYDAILVGDCAEPDDS
jgi:hypothetical protein